MCVCMHIYSTGVPDGRILSTDLCLLEIKKISFDLGMEFGQYPVLLETCSSSHCFVSLSSPLS